jgi:hypothetical protein
MADQVTTKPPLRHRAEIPTFVIMVILNVVILLVLIDFLASLALIPPALRGTNWQAVWRVAAGAIILVAPALMIGRQIQRASIRGTAVQLSRTQFPDLYASMDDFAATLGLKHTPALYLANGNGALNAFAAQRYGQHHMEVMRLRTDLGDDHAQHSLDRCLRRARERTQADGSWRP